MLVIKENYLEKNKIHVKNHSTLQGLDEILFKTPRGLIVTFTK